MQVTIYNIVGNYCIWWSVSQPLNRIHTGTWFQSVEMGWHPHPKFIKSSFDIFSTFCCTLMKTFQVKNRSVFYCSVSCQVCNKVFLTINFSFFSASHKSAWSFASNDFLIFLGWLGSCCTLSSQMRRWCVRKCVQNAIVWLKLFNEEVKVFISVPKTFGESCQNSFANLFSHVPVADLRHGWCEEFLEGLTFVSFIHYASIVQKP